MAHYKLPRLPQTSEKSSNYVLAKNIYYYLFGLGAVAMHFFPTFAVLDTI